MLFSSPYYIFVFLPIVILVYFSLNKFHNIQLAKAWLIFSSLYFYGYWNPKYIFLIIISILLNFTIGKALHKTKNNISYSIFHRKLVLSLGIIINLGILGYYKYSDFFISNLNYLSGMELPLLHLVLPLAISFFTFQQIAYLVDCYQFDTQEYDFLNYCLFVSFFPQLIAGPIVHHKEMMPQFSRLRNSSLNYNNVAKGLFIFCIGLFKKVGIADSFAVWANEGFAHSSNLGFLEAWGTSLSYSFQLYYDFSGYSDMAIGAALMFNIYLPINFNSPYKATSIQDFWRRWHMTLSRWLRDYIYIPLGGNRKGTYHTYNNILVTFLIGGLWHGAGWTFIIWGALHGIAMLIHRLWQSSGIKITSLVSWALTFLFINFSWIFFRATNLESAFNVLKGMSGLNGFNAKIDLSSFKASFWHWLPHTLSDKNGQTTFSITTVQFIIIFGLITFLAKNSIEIGLNKTRYNYIDIFAVCFSLFLGILFSVSSKASPFLYFNF